MGLALVFSLLWLAFGHSELPSILGSIIMFLCAEDT